MNELSADRIDEYRSMNIPALLDAWDDVRSVEEADMIRALLEEWGYRTASLTTASYGRDGSAPATAQCSSNERAVIVARMVLLLFTILLVLGTTTLTHDVWKRTGPPGLADTRFAAWILVAVLGSITAAFIALCIVSRHVPELALRIASILLIGSILLDVIKVLNSMGVAGWDVTPIAIRTVIALFMIAVFRRGARAAGGLESAREFAAAQIPPSRGLADR